MRIWWGRYWRLGTRLSMLSLGAMGWVPDKQGENEGFGVSESSP